MATGRPFKPGNKAGTGRPPGSRNKDNVFQEVLERDGEKIIELIKRRALKSNPTAMKLCMERLLPVARAGNARFRLPPVDTAAGLTGAISAVAQAVAEGELSAQEGESVARIIEGQRRNLELGEFEARIVALEEAGSKRGPE
jgi:AcrR family transcriptional regulator